MVSACLLGIKCRYDGKSKPNRKILALAKSEILLPVCPEQLGGLPTPRPRAEIIGKSGRTIKVFGEKGEDLTANFQKGAEETLRIAKLFKIKEAIFKQKSPSCGCGKIHNGTFSGKVIKGDGITTALLKKNKIRVNSEEEL